MRQASGWDQRAVMVNNASKAFGSGDPVLDNFDMTVDRGRIYGLLGASGCGKTTILSCIVGILRLDSGSVSVFGAKPGTKESGVPGKIVGYMPQDIALYAAFTKREMLNYFGKIYEMSKSEVDARTEFLINFLDLHNISNSQLIGTLSGGEQRRVSLAVAMIHKPPLLILDEPTVGVDPLIREKIWLYLRETVISGGTTVIITTHYIEEARQADTVGLMRNGRLIAEKSPVALFAEYNSDLLEDIVLKLCKTNDEQQQSLAKDNNNIKEAFHSKSYENSRKREEAIIGLDYKSRSPDDYTIFLRSRSRTTTPHGGQQSFLELMNSHWIKLCTLVMGNFLQMARRPLFVIFFLFIPTLQIIMFNIVVRNDPKHLSFGLVNPESEYCEQNDMRSEGCLTGALSCKYLELFGDDIDFIPASTVAEGLEDVKMGRSMGVLSLPTNFTSNMKDRILLRNFAEEKTLNGTSLSIHMDFSDRLRNLFVLRELHKNYLDLVKNIVFECGKDPRIADVPLKFQAIYGSVNPGQLEYMQPTQIFLIIFLLPMSVGVTYLWDKRGGTLNRNLIAGVDFVHVIISLIISNGILIIVELIICFSVLILFLNFNVQGSFFLCFMICLMMGICGLSFGFLFGVSCDHETDIMVWLLFVYISTITPAGGIWPREGISMWYEILTSLLPMTYPCESIRSIVSRGWGLTHKNVWPGFAMIIGWTVLICFLSWVVHRKRH